MNEIFKTRKIPGGMLFIKRFNQIFVVRYLFLQIVSSKWGTYYINNANQW